MILLYYGIQKAEAIHKVLDGNQTFQYITIGYYIW